MVSAPAGGESSGESLGFFAQLGQLSRAGRAFWLVNMVNLTDGLAYFGILALLEPFFSGPCKFGEAASGWAVTYLSGMLTLFMLTFGKAVDRWGVRRALTLSLALSASGRLLLPLTVYFADSPWRFPFAFLCLTLASMGAGIMQPALYAGVRYCAPRHLQTMGFSMLYAMMNLGALLSALVSPFLRTDGMFFGVRGLNWGIRGVFLTLALTTVFQLFVQLLLFRQDVHVEGAAEAKAGGGVIRDPRLLFFIFILVPVRSLFAHQFLTVPSYVFRCFGKETSDHMEWLVNALNNVVVTFGVPLLSHWTRKVRVLKMMIVGTAVSAATSFILVLPPDQNRLVFYVVWFSIGEALWASRFLEYVADLAPPGKVAEYMGFANVPWFIAKTTTGLYSGVLMAYFIPLDGARHPETLWAIYGTFASLSPLGLMLAYRWLKNSSAPAESEPNESSNIGITPQSEEEP